MLTPTHGTSLQPISVVTRIASKLAIQMTSFLALFL
jgi:hypothetical protein